MSPPPYLRFLSDHFVEIYNGDEQKSFEVRNIQHPSVPVEISLLPKLAWQRKGLTCLDYYEYTPVSIYGLADGTIGLQTCLVSDPVPACANATLWNSPEHCIPKIIKGGLLDQGFIATTLYNENKNVYNTVVLDCGCGPGLNSSIAQFSTPNKVYDLSWTWRHPDDLLISIEDSLCLYDIRQPQAPVSALTFKGAARNLTASKFRESLVATVVSGYLHVFDFRRFTAPIVTEVLQTDEVSSLQWHPRNVDELLYMKRETNSVYRIDLSSYFFSETPESSEFDSTQCASIWKFITRDISRDFVAHRLRRYNRTKEVHSMLETTELETLSVNPDSKVFVWDAPIAQNARKPVDSTDHSERKRFRITRKHRLSASEINESNNTRLRLRHYLTSVNRIVKTATSSEKTSHQWSQPHYRKKKRDRKRHKQDVRTQRKQKCPSIELSQFKRDQNQEILKLLEITGLDAKTTEKLQTLLKRRICSVEMAGLTTSNQLSHHIIQEIHNYNKERVNGADFQFCYQFDDRISSFAMGQLGYSGLLCNTPSGELQFVKSLLPEESLSVPVSHCQKLSEANIRDVSSVSRPHLAETIRKRLKTKLGRLTTEQGYKNAIADFPIEKCSLWRMWVDASAKFYECTSVVLLMEKNDERQKQQESDESGVESEMFDMKIINEKRADEAGKKDEKINEETQASEGIQVAENKTEAEIIAIFPELMQPLEETPNIEEPKPLVVEIEETEIIALLSPEAPLLEGPLPASEPTAEVEVVKCSIEELKEPVVEVVECTLQVVEETKPIKHAPQNETEPAQPVESVELVEAPATVPEVPVPQTEVSEKVQTVEELKTEKPLEVATDLPASESLSTSETPEAPEQKLVEETKPKEFEVQVEDIPKPTELVAEAQGAALTAKPTELEIEALTAKPTELEIEALTPKPTELGTEAQDAAITPNPAELETEAQGAALTPNAAKLETEAQDAAITPNPAELETEAQGAALTPKPTELVTETQVPVLNQLTEPVDISPTTAEAIKRDEFRVTFNDVIYYSNHDGTSGEYPFPPASELSFSESVGSCEEPPALEEVERKEEVIVETEIEEEITFVPFLEEAYALEIGKPSGSKQHRLEMMSYTIPVRENRTVSTFEEACIFDFMIKGYPGLLQLAELNENAKSSVLEDFDVMSQTPLTKIHRSVYRTRMLIPFGLQYSNFVVDEPGDLCLEVMYASLLHGEFIKFANLAETMFITFDVDRSYGKSSLQMLGLLVKSIRELAKIWSFYYEYREVRTLTEDLSRLHKRIGRFVEDEESLRECPGLLKLMLLFIHCLAGRGNPSSITTKVIELKNVELPFKLLWMVNYVEDASLLKHVEVLMSQAKKMDKLMFVGLGRHTDCLTQLSNHLYSTGDYQLISHLLVSSRVFEDKRLYFNKWEQAVALDFHSDDESPLKCRDYSDEAFDINEYMKSVMESTQENSKLISQVLSQGRFSPPYHLDEFFPRRYLHTPYPRDNFMAMARACIVRYFCLLDSLGKGAYKQCLLGLLGNDTFHRPQTIGCKTELQCNFCGQPRTVSVHKQPKKEEDKLKGLRPPPMKPGKTAGRWIAEEKRRQEQVKALAENREVPEVTQEVSSDGNGDTSEAEKKSAPVHACHGCGKSFPRCAVCSLADRAIIRIDHAAGPIATHFVACTKCSHGGHVYHMLQWFEDGNKMCPIPECSCECDVLPHAERISAP